MNRKYTIFIFRRDLRIQDNKGFIFACENFENVIPIFIFTPEQTYENPYIIMNSYYFESNYFLVMIQMCDIKNQCPRIVSQKNS